MVARTKFFFQSEANWPLPIFIDEPSQDDVEVMPVKYVGPLQVKKPNPIENFIQNSSNIVTIKRTAAMAALVNDQLQLINKKSPEIGEKWPIPLSTVWSNKIDGFLVG
jgi:hypothetical protein